MSRVSFVRIGDLVRERVDAAPERVSHAILRARLVDAATQRRHRPVWYMAPTGVAFAAALVLGVIGWFWVKPLRGPASLSFTVGTEQAHGELGAYVAPIGERDLPLGFSDGSTIELQPAARARVTRTAANGASLILETGRASFEVVHREGNDWNVSAGPYTVHVTGTSFNVAWDPSASQVQVSVRRGAVIVRGPGAESGVEVRTSQRFVSSAVARVEEHADAAVSDVPPFAVPVNVNELPADPAAANTAVTAKAQDPGRAAASPHATNVTNAAQGGGAADSWATLVARGDYRRVVESAEQRGIDESLRSVNAGELGALADAARFTGRGDVARRALLAIRSRFAGSERAVSAAFLLGKLTEDLGRPKAAVEWYDRYLAEAPGGPLAPEAMGRRMLALQHNGDTDGAHRAAADYLKRFPNGPYAGVARETAKP